MSNGLLLNLKEFESLPRPKQLSCLYENQVNTLKLIRGYKFYQKISATVGSFLALGVGILFKLQLGAK